EDADGSAHLPLQNCDRGLPCAGWRSVPSSGIASRRDRLLRRKQRDIAAPSCVHAHAELWQFADIAEPARRTTDRRFHRGSGKLGFRSRGRGPLMTFSTELEAKFEKRLQAYPEGRTRSAVRRW